MQMQMQEIMISCFNINTKITHGSYRITNNMPKFMFI